VGLFFYGIILYMDYLNKAGTITIDGIEFDVPKKDDLNKWDYREWKEGKSKYKEVWLDSYQRNGKEVCRMSYSLQLKNGASPTLDDKKLKGDDIEKAKYIFKNIEG